MIYRALLWFVLCAAVHGAFAERYALLVGNGAAPGPSFAALKYVKNDCASLRAILTDFCGFSPRHVTVLYDRPPADLEKAFAEMAGGLAGSAGNLFFFYYSGHADASSIKMASGDFPLEKIKESLASFPADIRIGVFDACQSGSFTRIKGGSLSEPFLFRDDGKAKGQVILCSSSINENAQESDLLGNSVFTFHFVNALRGSADMAGDGRITLNEAYQYAYNHTVSSTAGSAGGVQHPSYQFRIQGEGDIVLADLNVRTQGILLTSGIEGDVTILSDKDAVVADLTKKRGTAVMIALAPGAYTVMNEQGGLRFRASAAVAEKSVTTLGRKDFHQAATSPSTAKGKQPMRIAQMGITISGGAGVYDLSGLSEGLSRRFAGFGAYSMSPNFSYRKYPVIPSIAIEVIAREQFEAHVGFGGFTQSSSADCAGDRYNPADGSYYACRLHASQRLDVNIIDAGVGYRFRGWFLRNASVHAGVALYRPRLDVSSEFYDSLYDIQTSGAETRSASVAVPYAALGYTWPAARFLDVGAKIRYRWQYRPAAFDNGYSGSLPEAASPTQPPLSCTFGGFDGAMFVNLHLSFDRHEERQ
jgi:hypothetical protein